jgi:hypothetical protein
LFTYSEDFAGWLNAGGTVTTNTAISPDGTQNADTLTGARYQISLGANIFTFTCFAKKLDGDNKFVLRFDVPATVFAQFDLNTGTIDLTSAGYTSSITAIGNGWYRCSLTSTSTITITNAVVVSASGGTFSTYVWGAQIEASSYPTSYIPTTSASATRVADVMHVNLPNTDMTFCAYLECEEAPLGTTVGDWLSIYSDISILGRGYGYANTFGFADTYAMGIASSTKMVWKQESGTTAKLFKNGALAATSTTGTYTDPFNRFRIDGAYLDKPLKIKEFVFFQNNLTDAECAALTA